MPPETEPPAERPGSNTSFKYLLMIDQAIIKRIFELMMEEMDRAVADTKDENANALNLAKHVAKWRKMQEWVLSLHQIFEKRYGKELDMLRLVAEVYDLDTGNVLQADDISKRLEWYKKRLAKDFERSVVGRVETHAVKSPIEQVFLMEWEYQKIEARLGVTLTPQQKVVIGHREYHVDFVVTKPGHQLNIAIELDGHEFHERTKEQAAKDRARERALTVANFTVVRFTGSEIIKNPRRCVEETVTLIGSRISPM
jgi:very-short-patch-repair endonuclease